jgi:hypothetical protein
MATTSHQMNQTIPFTSYDLIQGGRLNTISIIALPPIKYPYLSLLHTTHPNITDPCHPRSTKMSAGSHRRLTPMQSGRLLPLPVSSLAAAFDASKNTTCTFRKFGVALLLIEEPDCWWRTEQARCAAILQRVCSS